MAKASKGDIESVGRTTEHPGHAIIPRKLLRPSKHLLSWTKCIVVKQGATFKLYRESSKAFLMAAVRLQGTSIMLLSTGPSFPANWRWTPQDAAALLGGAGGRHGSGLVPPEGEGEGGEGGASQQVRAMRHAAAVGSALALPPQQRGAAYCAVLRPALTHPLSQASATPPSAAAGAGGEADQAEHQHPFLVSASAGRALVAPPPGSNSNSWFALELVSHCENCDDRLGKGVCSGSAAATEEAPAPAPVPAPSPAPAPATSPPKSGGVFAGALSTLSRTFGGSGRSGKITPLASAPQEDPKPTPLGATGGTAMVRSGGQLPPARPSPARRSRSQRPPRVRQCLALIGQYVRFLPEPDVDVRCLAAHIPRVWANGTRAVWCPRNPRVLWTGFVPRLLGTNVLARGGSGNHAPHADMASALLAANGMGPLTVQTAAAAAPASSGLGRGGSDWQRPCHLLSSGEWNPPGKSSAAFGHKNTYPWRESAVLDWEAEQAKAMSESLQTPVARRRKGDAGRWPTPAGDSQALATVPGHALRPAPGWVDGSGSAEGSSAPSSTMRFASSAVNGSSSASRSEAGGGPPQSSHHTPSKPSGIVTATEMAAVRQRRAEAAAAAAAFDQHVAGAEQGAVHVGPPTAEMVHSGPPSGDMMPPGRVYSSRTPSWVSDGSDTASVRSSHAGSIGGGAGGGGGGSRVLPNSRLNAAQRVRLKRLMLGFTASSDGRSRSVSGGSVGWGSTMSSFDSDGVSPAAPDSTTGHATFSFDGGGDDGEHHMGRFEPIVTASALSGGDDADGEGGLDAEFEGDGEDGDVVQSLEASRGLEGGMGARGLTSVASALSVIAEAEDSRLEASRDWGGRRTTSVGVGQTRGLRASSDMGSSSEQRADSDVSGVEVVRDTSGSLASALLPQPTDKPGAAPTPITVQPAKSDVQPPMQVVQTDMVPLHSSSAATATQMSDVATAVQSYTYEAGCDPVPLDTTLLVNRLPEWNPTAKTLTMKFLGSRVTGSSSRNFLMEVTPSGGGVQVAAAAAAASGAVGRVRPSALARMHDVAGGGADDGDVGQDGPIPPRVVRPPSVPSLQFGRLQGNTYSLDYRHPLCTAQAFAIFLASFMWSVSPSSKTSSGKRRRGATGGPPGDGASSAPRHTRDASGDSAASDASGHPVRHTDVTGGHGVQLTVKG